MPKLANRIPTRRYYTFFEQEPYFSINENGSRSRPKRLIKLSRFCSTRARHTGLVTLVIARDATLLCNDSTLEDNNNHRNLTTNLIHHSQENYPLPVLTRSGRFRQYQRDRLVTIVSVAFS